MYCSKCGNEIDVGASFCSKCGAPVNLIQISDLTDDYSPKSSTGTALLAMFAGFFGVHDFYVGKTQIGVAKAVMAFFGIFAFQPVILVSLVWQFIDVIRIAFGLYHDGNDRPIRSGFWTVVFTTIAAIALVIVSVAIIRILIAKI